MDKNEKPCPSCEHQEQCFGLVCNCGYKHWGSPMLEDNIKEFEGCQAIFEPQGPSWCAVYTPARKGNRL